MKTSQLNKKFKQKINLQLDEAILRKTNELKERFEESIKKTPQLFKKIAEKVKDILPRLLWIMTLPVKYDPISEQLSKGIEVNMPPLSKFYGSRFYVKMLKPKEYLIVLTHFYGYRSVVIISTENQIDFLITVSSGSPTNLAELQTLLKEKKLDQMQLSEMESVDHYYRLVLGLKEALIEFHSETKLSTYFTIETKYSNYKDIMEEYLKELFETLPLNPNQIPDAYVKEILD